VTTTAKAVVVLRIVGLAPMGIVVPVATDAPMLHAVARVAAEKGAAVKAVAAKGVALVAAARLGRAGGSAQGATHVSLPFPRPTRTLR
jgi:hypothetical protein